MKLKLIILALTLLLPASLVSAQSKKKDPKAALNQAENYFKLYRFDESVTAYEEYIELLTKKKQDTESVKPALEKSKMGARMIKGVEEVNIVDSFVVNKKDFLSVYKLSEESGHLYTYNDFFRTKDNAEGTVCETELANKLYYSMPNPKDKTMSIYSKNKLLDEWSKASKLPESINQAANTNYPFVMADGITTYYAADGENSLGGYDIFVTRYNTSTDSYLTPENVGMPFNSPYNDYMYVIDEFNELGWFASDRYQPEGKVCIYVFIPNEFKHTYNFEAMEPGLMTRLARINAIHESWKDVDMVRAAQKRLADAIQQKPKQTHEYDFVFVINDGKTYHSMREFRSPQARESFKRFQRLEKDYRQQTAKLESQRKWYTDAGEQERKKTTAAIIDLEKRVLQMYDELKNLERSIRNEENRIINP